MSDRWPVHGRLCERAAVKLIQALEGEATPDDAAGLCDATEEAGILIGDAIPPSPEAVKRKQ
jgi:hypothetical protein